MKCYQKRYINLVTLIVAIILVVQTNFLTVLILNIKTNRIEELDGEKNIKKLEEKQEEWKITIPKLEIQANIKEGITDDIINNNVGHFEDTETWNGNIGLIGASNGFKENYFCDLEKLMENDVILYQKGEEKRQYKVITNTTIQCTDWSYLSSTKDNRITLITGIINDKEKRRCVQATQI